tara:strand:+ start:1896 stop:2786 length:891 start_codon:yes stop_codon:yes gene_type:complete
MKIYFEFNFQKGAWGGGNQFLKSLRSQLQLKGIYTSNPTNSDIIMFNSHQNNNAILSLRRKFPNKKFVHRVDGPMRLYNKMSDRRDDIVYRLNQISDGTVFQSRYSFDSNIKLGMSKPNKYAIIKNCCDTDIFKTKSHIGTNKKTRIISTSFSDNVKKGFNTYKFLDDKLDFSKYEYVFAGRPPVKFNNIKTLGRLDTKGVADELFCSDIYITASENDPCSNSLIEAQTVGIPTIALNSGGHPELTNENSELFDNNGELIHKLELVSCNLYKYFSKKSKILPIDICNQYISFFNQL